MSRANQSPWKYAILWLRIYFGAHLFYSGARFILTSYVPEIPGIGGAYVAAASDIYIFQIIKYMECVLGLMLLTNRGVLLALMLEMPATVNIFWLNTFIVATPRQLFTGPQELFMNGALLLAYGGYYVSVLQAKVEPMWLWDGLKKVASARERGEAAPTSAQQIEA
ncbi:conserved membrane protein of unknown function (plasmid) [Cupriavidus taiwanensis]|uniref:DoxX family protein n=1 Tax=Cupriavidus taiwanensis TaxID=164546 RepID=A0A375ITF4_9BURK|nr:hypothetical protein [Cupriavidus taiwanensis]SPK76515.1 conserved membrane protein of unknown function [Cupriavidus taiwanensis]